MLCPRHCALPEPPSASGRTWICSGGWTDFRLVPSEDVSKGATGASRTACESIRPCDVVPYDPARLFAYTVGDRFDATPATRWSYLITSANEGCLVRQEFAHLPDGLSGLRLRAEELDDAEVILAVRREKISAGMALTLERMRIVLAG